MTKPRMDAANDAAAWEAAGRQIAPMLGSYSAAVVTSSDVMAAAYAALGIGRAEAEHRRVAVGDLVGEVPPIQRLVRGDDPHGISDSFTYGVSLNKIARPVDAAGNLFIMPSGTESVSDPEIFRNARWQRLANGFREVGALLLLVAPANAPGLRELIDQLDGVVLVGATPLDLAPYINVIARIPAPLRAAPRGSEKGPLALWKIAALLLLLVAGIGVGLFFGRAGESETTRSLRARTPAVVAPVATPPVSTDTMSIAAPANPSDSASASVFAVELGTWNSRDDAADALKSGQGNLPAATISPVPVGPQRETYYKVISGAYPTRREADALLAYLRHRQITPGGLGTVVRTPYALLLDSATAGHSTDLVRRFAGVREAEYVLAQPDGSVKLYVGAFERPEDAASLIQTLRARNLSPVLVYRVGRAP